MPTRTIHRPCGHRHRRRRSSSRRASVLDGYVADVRLVGDAQPDLAQSAIAAVREWRYTETLLNCTPVEVDDDGHGQLQPATASKARQPGPSYTSVAACAMFGRRTRRSNLSFSSVARQNHARVCSRNDRARGSSIAQYARACTLILRPLLSPPRSSAWKSRGPRRR